MSEAKTLLKVATPFIMIAGVFVWAKNHQSKTVPVVEFTVAAMESAPNQIHYDKYFMECIYDAGTVEADNSHQAIPDLYFEASQSIDGTQTISVSATNVSFERYIKGNIPKQEAAEAFKMRYEVSLKACEEAKANNQEIIANKNTWDS